MKKSRRVRSSASQAAAGAVLLLGVALGVRAQPPAAAGGTPASTAPAGAPSDEPVSLPQDGLFSSIKQSLREGDQEIIRGHFELGAAPNVRRYYCLMDPKSHRREPNGVLGDPLPRPDGMTGIKSSAVSLYRCDKAEEKGLLVTAGYLVPAHTAAAAASSAASPAAATAAPAAAAPVMAAAAPAAASAAPLAALPPAAPMAAAAAPTSPFGSGMVDISGVKLGMSPDEVRAVIGTKNLHKHNEWTETLSYRDGSGKNQAVPNGRFVNVIAASSSSSTGDGNYDIAGESFEVMFTPVPGHEQAMAIVHTIGYSASNAVHEAALENGLIKKYGGTAASADLPQAPTWLYQASGTVTLGDTCGRRDVLGGIGPLHVSSARENIALQKSAGELQYGVQHCGIAIVTEDHHLANGGALREDRVVTRYTVTAYSPTLAAQGSARAQEILRAEGSHRQPTAPAPDSHSPDL